MSRKRLGRDPLNVLRIGVTSLSGGTHSGSTIATCVTHNTDKKLLYTPSSFLPPYTSLEPAADSIFKTSKIIMSSSQEDRGTIPAYRCGNHWHFKPYKSSRRSHLYPWYLRPAVSSQSHTESYISNKVGTLQPRSYSR